jgi:antitoxin ParD1/3/4
MATVEKISIALTPALAADVRRAVDTGEFASSSEVIRDALRAWLQARERRAVALDELRGLWREGVESGPGGALDADDIKRRSRGRLAASPPVGG